VNIESKVRKRRREETKRQKREAKRARKRHKLSAPTAPDFNTVRWTCSSPKLNPHVPRNHLDQSLPACFLRHLMVARTHRFRIAA
jgi:hypothetical protein